MLGELVDAVLGATRGDATPASSPITSTSSTPSLNSAIAGSLSLLRKVNLQLMKLDDA